MRLHLFKHIINLVLCIFLFSCTPTNKQQFTASKTVLGNYTPVKKHNFSSPFIVFQEKSEHFLTSHWLYCKLILSYKRNSLWMSLVIFMIILISPVFYFNMLLKRKVLKRTASLQKAMENVKRSSEIKTRFIQNISHEIRTPMNSILGFSELLKKENRTQKEHYNYINTIIDNGKYLTHLIDSILEVSNFQKGAVEINNEEIELKSFFDNIESYFASRAKKKGLTLEFVNTGSANNIIVVDKNRLKKITSNLIDNAIKFTPKGSITVSYNLAQDHSLEVKVKDTGNGIKEQDQEIIFEAFSQLEATTINNYKGLGLGLAIVKENINVLKGSLNFKSEINKGSEFIISIPCKKIIPPEKENNKELKKHTILVVEDSKLNFILVKTVLKDIEDFNFKILRAENGEEGVAMCDIHHKKIDLIIMDIRMPIMDGYEATTLIKKKYPELKIVAHTAYSTDEDIKKALSVGCETVLPKPIENKSFINAIVKYIRV